MSVNPVISNSLSTEWHLLIAFASSLDPDQARQNVGPDLGPYCLTLFEKVDFEKNQQMTQKSMKNYPEDKCWCGWNLGSGQMASSEAS